MSADIINLFEYQDGDVIDYCANHIGIKRCDDECDGSVINRMLAIINIRDTIIKIKEMEKVNKKEN